MFQTHQLAAAKRQRKTPKRTAPVSVVTVPPQVMAYARSLVECEARLRVQSDGTVMVVNTCRCHP